jgi:hypothetical protein
MTNGPRCRSRLDTCRRFLQSRSSISVARSSVQPSSPASTRTKRTAEPRCRLGSAPRSRACSEWRSVPASSVCGCS